MSLKWFGAVMIVMACGGFGMALGYSQRREEVALQQLLGALDFMECELQYRLTPLPELCRQAGERCGGCIGDVLQKLSRELEAQIAPDVASCMNAALSGAPELPAGALRQLRELGENLGRFDLQGQLRGLETVRSECTRNLERLRENAPQRHRTYRTLGFCAGVALVILFL